MRPTRRKPRTLLPPLSLWSGFTAVALLGLATPRAARAQTDYLREFSKNKTPILLVTSGPAAIPVAQMLEDSVRHNRDFGGRPADDVRIVPLADLPQAVQSARRAPTVVFFLAGREMKDDAPLPPTVARLMPFDLAALHGQHGVNIVQGAMDRDKPGEAIFRVALFAPDAPRLRRLYEEMKTRRVANFRELPFVSRHESNRIAVFSAPTWEKTLKGWGEISRPAVWNECRWYPLSQRASLTSDDLDETTEVYFLDRSHLTNGDVPEPAAHILATHAARPTTVLTARGQEKGNDIIVVSAPTVPLLYSRISGRPTVAALEREPASVDVLDMSRLGSTNLLVLGGGEQVTPDILTAVQAELSKDLRGKMHIAVEPRGPVLARLEADLAVQMAQGAEGTQGILQRRFPTRYVWVYTLTDVSGGTTYTPSERRITPDLAAFTDEEPTRPGRKKDENEDDYADRVRKWRDKHSQWDRARREHDDHYENDSCEWEQQVTSHTVVHARGLMQLIDTQTPNGAKFVWEKACAFDANDQKTYQTKRTSVRGYGARPGSLETPPSSDRCPSGMVLAAVTRAGNDGLSALRAEALLPEELTLADIEAGPITSVAATVVPAVVRENSSPAPTGAAKIADIDGKTITLNIGANQNVRVGDRFDVLLQVKETTDPDTGRVLRVRALDSFQIVVTHVDAETVDCTPVPGSDSARVSRARIGTRVRPAATR